MELYDLLLAKSLNGGGGSATGIEIVEVTATYDSEQESWFYETDKSFNDLMGLLLAGKNVIMTWVEETTQEASGDDPAVESVETYYAPMNTCYSMIVDSGETHTEEYNVMVGRGQFALGAYDPDVPMSSGYED